jgi:hypothetical protein
LCSVKNLTMFNSCSTWNSKKAPFYSLYHLHKRSVSDIIKFG